MVANVNQMLKFQWTHAACVCVYWLNVVDRKGDVSLHQACLGVCMFAAVEIQIAASTLPCVFVLRAESSLVRDYAVLSKEWALQYEKESSVDALVCLERVYIVGKRGCVTQLSGRGHTKPQSVRALFDRSFTIFLQCCHLSFG